MSRIEERIEEIASSAAESQIDAWWGGIDINDEVDWDKVNDIAHDVLFDTLTDMEEWPERFKDNLRMIIREELAALVKEMSQATV